MKCINRILLLCILLIAAIARFYNLFEIPFTLDEFSALERTEFSSFSELIDKGVKIDGHPAGIQVFLYYWTKLFGYSEWIVKLPFILCGLASVLLVYMIAEKWYNETVGLIVAAFLASIQYTILYSQIARPYISGLFFSLLMVYFWTLLMQSPQNRFYRNSFFFIIFGSLCTYNHHFSMLFAAIVGISGLFFIKKEYLLRYIFSGVLIVILYLPHLPVFLYQLNVGGVESWLAKPHYDFIIYYVEYIFHFSIWSLLLVLLLVVLGLFRIKRKDIQYKYFLLSVCWFGLPFLIGFIYSVEVNSVLQYSVLIFSFPYLLFILFGHIQPQSGRVNVILVVLILVVNSYTLIYARKHYTLFYQSIFPQILNDYTKACSSNKDVVALIDSDRRITGIYTNKLHTDTNYRWMDSFASQNEFIAFIKENSTKHDHLYLGGGSSINPIYVPIILDYYPSVEWQHNYAGGTTYLFSTKPQKQPVIDLIDFESAATKSWISVDTAKMTHAVAFSGNTAYLMDSTMEWSPSYIHPIRDILKHENDFVNVSVMIKTEGKKEDIILAVGLESKGETITWGGITMDKFTSPKDSANTWIRMHNVVKFSDVYLNYPDIQLKVFVWNRGKQNLLMDDFLIERFPGNPVIYGLNEKID